MKITLIFTLSFSCIQFLHSACYGPTMNLYGFNTTTLTYESIPYSSSSNVINTINTTNPFYITLCPRYSHVKMVVGNGTGSYNWSDGTTGGFCIINPNDSISFPYEFFGVCTGIYTLTFKVIPSDLQLTVPPSIALTTCNQGYEINGISSSGGNGQVYYSYNFISGNGNITYTNPMQPIVSEVYSNSQLNVTIQDSKCTVNDTINIISAISDSMYAEVCLLTIDSTNSHNLVTWEKNPNMGVVTYRIHKQSTLTSQYEMIHEQAYSSLSEYVDLSSNASQEVARYKVSALDSCGNESTISPNHTTILLSSNLGASSVNLSWNPYEGFSYPNFEIWRSLNGGISYNLLANVANNTYAYIDNNAPQQAYYQIRISNGTGCITTKNSFNQVKSNIVDQAGNSVGISEINSSDAFSIFPNPTNEMFYVKSNQFQTGNKFELVDNSGRIVLSGILQNDNQSIDVSKLSRGIYNLNVIGSQSKTMKLVKN